MFGWKKHPNLLKLYAAEISDDLGDRLSWRRHYRRRRLVMVLTYAVWLLSALLIIAVINVLLFLPGLKTIYSSALSGKNNLQQAVALMNQEQWPAAQQTSQTAAADFNRALNALNNIRYSPIGWLPFAHGKLNDVRYVLTSGNLLSQALNLGAGRLASLTGILSKQPNWDFSRLSQQQKYDLIKNIADSQTDWQQARADLAQAAADLGKINDPALLLNYGLDVAKLRQSLEANEPKLAQAATLAKLLPILGGYPDQANYLFVLQNNDELRPTGGFIGTYGLATLSNGELKDLLVNDVYHLDMPVKDKLQVAPPPELKKYLNIDRWYLRDANWSPDWPTAAQKILWFYNQENNLSSAPSQINRFTAVIGLTPQVMIDLLKITGPVKVGGQIYNQANFMALLQDTTGRDYSQFGLSRWDRKSVIGDITKAMQLKIFSAWRQNWQQLLTIISDNLDKKNILVYTANPILDQALQPNNWSGRVQSTDGDYIMVVDANLAALKTDAAVNKSLDYSLEEVDGGLVARLTINYANRGGFTWKTTRYRTYTRVYVPLGSELIKAAGFIGQPGEVAVGQDLGKTYFGAFTEIEPCKIGGLSFEYKLPYNLYALYKKGAYSLLLQKQPGSQLNSFNLDWQFNTPIKSYEPNILYVYATGSRFRYKSDFLTDKNFVLKF